MSVTKTKFHFYVKLSLLLLCAVLLIGRIFYAYFDNKERFPITAVKVTANFEHVSREKLEERLSIYTNASYFSIDLSRLESVILSDPWVESVSIQKIWPDTLKIKLVETTPLAFWNNQLIAKNGKYLGNDNNLINSSLPKLNGPENQQADVLHIYEKLSKLLTEVGLQVGTLHLRENQAWELTLATGVQLQLGKRDLEERMRRFCIAYPHVFKNKKDQLSSVDLRYAHGMAANWKE